MRPANNARFTFLAPRSRDFYCDWERVANDIVAILRAEAGRDPYDRGLLDGTVEPGRVFDRTVILDDVPDGYRDGRPRGAQGARPSLT